MFYTRTKMLSLLKVFSYLFFLLYFLVIDHNTRSSLVKQGGTGQKQTLEAFFTFYMTLM